MHLVDPAVGCRDPDSDRLSGIRGGVRVNWSLFFFPQRRTALVTILVVDIVPERGVIYIGIKSLVQNSRPIRIRPQVSPVFL